MRDIPVLSELGAEEVPRWLGLFMNRPVAYKLAPGLGAAGVITDTILYEDSFEMKMELREGEKVFRGLYESSRFYPQAESGAESSVFVLSTGYVEIAFLLGLGGALQLYSTISRSIELGEGDTMPEEFRIQLLEWLEEDKEAQWEDIGPGVFLDVLRGKTHRGESNGKFK